MDLCYYVLFNNVLYCIVFTVYECSIYWTVFRLGQGDKSPLMEGPICVAISRTGR